MGETLDEEINQLARRVEAEIERMKQRIEETPDFAPRSSRSKKLRRLTRR